ncbi:hypothetical protein [Nocardioides sambongensis]|uniref:hypothetical protein n=1 Tax=Nocardioides sambongensis TaxID=2589074 RepID=UPI0011266C3D|nr:hypothetical protein [Nocardioides sambongensis]
MLGILARCWQQINGGRHSCHFWQIFDRRMITAMTLLLLLLGLAVVAGTLQMVLRDARPHVTPPASHTADPAFLPPGGATQ